MSYKSLSKERRQEVREYVRKNYLTTPARTISEQMGVSLDVIYYYASPLGLRRHKKRKKATPAKTPKFINPMIYFICNNWKRGPRYWECLTH